MGICQDHERVLILSADRSRVKLSACYAGGLVRSPAASKVRRWVRGTGIDEVGVHKVEVIPGALRGGFLDVLVTKLGV